MWLTDFMVSVPAAIRMVLAIGITVLVSLFFVKVFHEQILRINASPSAQEDDPEPPPSVKDLAGRLIALSTFAFVFLLGFAFNQFWGTSKDARDAVLDEAHQYTRAVILAESLPNPAGTNLVTALKTYQATIVNDEWKLMQAADTDRLDPLQSDAATKLGDAVQQAMQAGATSAPQWNDLSSTLSDLLDDGVSRTEALPSRNAVGFVMLVFILGLANLFFVAMWTPTLLKQNMWLIGVMAALTGFLLFIVVEVSNPYVGATALAPLIGNL